MEVEVVVSALDYFGKSHPVTPDFPADAERFTNRASSSPSVKNAAQAVSSLRARFRECFERELFARPNAHGQVRLTLHIAATGNVVSVEANAVGNLSEPLIDCVRVVADSAKFLPPERGSAVIQVPVTLINVGGPGVIPPCQP